MEVLSNKQLEKTIKIMVSYKRDPKVQSRIFQVESTKDVGTFLREVVVLFFPSTFKQMEARGRFYFTCKDEDFGDDVVMDSFSQLTTDKAKIFLEYQDSDIVNSEVSVPIHFDDDGSVLL